MRWALLALFVLLLIVGPLIFPAFVNQTLARIGVFAVAVLGLNVVMGYTGQVSLGQIFFVGVGAYVTAYGVNNDWNIALVFLLAMLIPGVIGLAVALAAARLGGLAIAMVTIALPIVGVPLAKRLSRVHRRIAGLVRTVLGGTGVDRPVRRPVAAVHRHRDRRHRVPADPQPRARQVRAGVRDRQGQRGRRVVDGHLAVPLQGARLHDRLPHRRRQRLPLHGRRAVHLTRDDELRALDLAAGRDGDRRGRQHPRIHPRRRVLRARAAAHERGRLEPDRGAAGHHPARDPVRTARRTRLAAAPVAAPQGRRPRDAGRRGRGIPCRRGDRRTLHVHVATLHRPRHHPNPIHHSHQRRGRTHEHHAQENADHLGRRGHRHRRRARRRVRPRRRRRQRRRRCHRRTGRGQPRHHRHEPDVRHHQPADRRDRRPGQLHGRRRARLLRRQERRRRHRVRRRQDPHGRDQGVRRRVRPAEGPDQLPADGLGRRLRRGHRTRHADQPRLARGGDRRGRARRCSS